MQGRTTCHYDATVRQSKDDIRTELGSLRQEQQFTEEVLAAVAAPDTSDEALDRLRRGQSIRSISAWAKETRDSMAGISPVSSQFVGSQASHESGASLTASSMNTSADNSTIMAPAYRLGSVSDPSSSANYIPQSSPGKFYPEYELGSELGFSGLEQTLWPILVPTTEPTSENWTSITDDINLVHHLLALYFSWEYPIFAPFNKELFLRDFHNGRRRYCSSLLTNAILALSCRLSTLPITRLDPTDPASAGDHFFNEALLLFDQETDHRSLTTIQALGVMSMREISCGRDQESRYYAGQSMRLAVEMGLNRISEKAEEDLFCVQIFTFWGAFSLDS